MWKKQSSVKITFSLETGQPMPTTWRRGKHGDMAFFAYDGSWGFLFTYVIQISWNKIKCNVICIKLRFMKQSERYISKCILAFRNFAESQENTCAMVSFLIKLHAWDIFCIAINNCCQVLINFVNQNLTELQLLVVLLTCMRTWEILLCTTMWECTV